MTDDLPQREFGWSDMWASPENDPRSEGGFHGERATLVNYLRDQRLTLELKCSGLDAEGLALQSVPPSNLSLLGLVRHMANVELGWFRIRLAGQDVPRLYRTEADRDGDFNGAVADPEVVANAFKTWHEQIAFAEKFVDDHELEFAGPQGHVLREVLIHMIEEYARHNGHADLIRERVDGRVGQ